MEQLEIGNRYLLTIVGAANEWSKLESCRSSANLEVVDLAGINLKSTDLVWQI